MPSTSKSQQHLFGMVHAYQKGKLKRPSPKIKEVAHKVSPTSALHFAETKTKGLPKHVKHMNKEAFERGFIKAAIDNNVNPALAIKLLKQANPLADQFNNLQLQGAINTGADAGLGGLAGTAIGGGLGYLGGRNKKHPENDHSIRDMIMLSTLGGVAGTAGGGLYGANKFTNNLNGFLQQHPEVMTQNNG